MTRHAHAPRAGGPDQGQDHQDRDRDCAARRNSVLIVGADGQIGAALRTHFARQGWRVGATSRQPDRHDGHTLFFDLAEPLGELPLADYDSVIICAAISSIAQCAERARECERINVTNTIALIERCVAAGCFVIFPSSNTVFDGVRPFQSHLDAPNPQTNYGRFKLAVENHILAHARGSAAVLRLTKVITDSAPFIERWHLDAAADAQIRAYANKLLSPVSLDAVTAAFQVLIDWRQGGIYQLGGERECSYFEYAQSLFRAEPSKLKLIKAADDPAAPPGAPSHNSLRTHMPNHCHACHQPALRPIPCDDTFSSVTSDCRPWRYPIALAVCSSCGLIQKRVTPDYIRQTEAIYQSYAIYKQSDGAEQSVFSSQGAEFARSDKIVEWLNRSASLGETGELLEIGCGNGSFLKKFSADKSGWRLLGTEFDAKNQALIEAIPNTRFHCGDLKQIERKFDLIVAIHLLEHIFDPISLLRECAGKLADDGKIFLQVPNVKESPFDILIADHCSHFSVESLVSLLTQSGFEILALSDTNVQKEIALILRPRRADQARETDQLSALIAGYLDLFASLKHADLPAGAEVGIFGSSISATWLAGELEGKIAFFTDEDSNRVGKTHLGLPILAIGDVPVNSVVLLPMNPGIAKSIAGRLAATGIQFILPAETT